MSDPSARTFSSDFKRFFLRGLVVLLPSVLTLWIVVKAYQFIDSAIAEPINGSVRLMIANVAPYWKPLRDQFDPSNAQLDAAVADRAISRSLASREAVRSELRRTSGADPSEAQVNAAIADRVAAQKSISPLAVQAEMRAEAIQNWWASHWYMNLIGLVVAIVAVYVAGRLLGGFLGRRVYKHVERIITSLPVFKQVYPYVKQIVDFLFSDEKAMQFNRVVVVEYPRKGIWSIGFQTGGTMAAIKEHTGESVTVFIPSSPTPFTGYAITVPRCDVLELGITVEEAIRFVVSGGVLLPDAPAGSLNASAEKQMIEAVAADSISYTTSERTTLALQAGASSSVQQDSGER